VATLKDSARAAAEEIAADPGAAVGVTTVVIELHMREALEQAVDVAQLWAVMRGTIEGRQAAEDLARELRVVMGVA
jgi:hypothetical protein